MLDGEAAKSGIELRRYTAQPTSSREFYTEVPFEIELDGSYNSMMTFFDHVAKLERIVNVSNLLVANVKKGSEAKAKHTYQYSASESVIATCLATTFFSHDNQPAATPATAKGRI
jgi:type IV pilus assembly protein PilO